MHSLFLSPAEPLVICLEFLESLTPVPPPLRYGGTSSLRLSKFKANYFVVKSSSRKVTYCTHRPYHLPLFKINFYVILIIGVMSITRKKSAVTAVTTMTASSTYFPPAQPVTPGKKPTRVGNLTSAANLLKGYCSRPREHAND